MDVNFQFSPLQHVKVKLFDINYKGRVLRCIREHECTMYDIQYVNDQGEFKRGEFNEDELVAL